MPRKKPKARKQPTRHISVRAVYRDQLDTKALAKALIASALTRPDADNHSDSAPQHPAA